MSAEYEHNMLFRPGPDWELNAAVGDNGGPYSFRNYADIIVYPLAYCYRHGIELYLKSLILHRPAALGQEGKIRKTHTLPEQWKLFLESAKVLDQIVLEPTIELSLAEDIITDFSEIDKSGQTFRYPENINGERHLVNQELINVGVLHEGMPYFIASSRLGLKISLLGMKSLPSSPLYKLAAT